MQKIITLSICFVALGLGAYSQVNILPNNHAPGEESIKWEIDERSKLGLEITSPPDFPVRTMAEWEEIQSLVITWAGFQRILKQIAFHAKQECEVIIVAENENTVINYLNANNAGGAPFDNLDNITIIEDDFNSIWGRDYGAHTVYRDGVDELILVDWIYNRNRPADDNVPISIAQHIGVPLYSTTESPYDLMATGGNFMSDGMGTAFSSELIFEENQGGMAWGGTQFPEHTEEEIDDILEAFMGIDRYIKMDVLPYDGIHHIDMHMKLLDEETLLFGEYPTGVADGPQIEANLQYVLSNFESSFGTPYEIVRVQMPPEGSSYPNNGGAYRTYTNMVFVNGTVLVPTYEEEYDTPALEIIQNELPGYNVVGIECNDIIELSGAIHCITKAVGVGDPLVANHSHLTDTEDAVNDYEIETYLEHYSGIDDAFIYYRIDGGEWIEVPLTLISAEDNSWSASIPAQSPGTEVQYYIYATSNTGRVQTRPVGAPQGFYTFNILDSSVGIEEFNEISPITRIYPNPANAITVIELNMPSSEQVYLDIKDMLGRTVEVIYDGDISFGESKHFIDASRLNQGVYSIDLVIGQQRYSSPLMVR